jgi:transcriptional regulator with XRE-family HTH domain
MTGKELKSLRMDAGLTQGRLADLADITLRAVQKYESGEIDVERIEVTTAERLAWALGVPVERFANHMAYEVGRWWNDNSISLVRISDGVYALYGWNGEEYGDCWKCTGDGFRDASKEKYTIRPVHEEVASDEYEIVDYEIV